MIDLLLMTGAQASARSAGEVVVWVGILIGAVILLFLVIQFFRRRLLAPDRPAEQERTLLEDLRDMRDAGHITQEEYDAARKSTVARMSARAESKQSGGASKVGSRDRTRRPPESR